MSFAPLGSLGSTSDYSTTHALSLSPSSDLAKGNIAVVWFASESVFSVFSPTNGGGYWKCEDSAGNVYSTIASITDARAFFREGALAVIFISQLRHDLTTGDTITVTAQTGLETGTTWAKAMSAEGFSLTWPRTWAVSGTGPAGARTDAADPSSTTLTLSATREWLLLHCLGLEGPATDSFTWDSDYTEIASAGTNTGTPSDDISVFGGYRIATLDVDTVDVTNTTSSTRDSSQLLVAVCETLPRLGFPHTPILDDFNRADENPLSAAAGWDDTSEVAYGSARAQLKSNRAAGSGGSYFNTTFSDCVEAFVSIPVFGETHLHVHAGGSTLVPAMDGNGVAWITTDGQSVGPYIHAGRSGNQGAIGGPVLKAWAPYGDGVKLGIQRAIGPSASLSSYHLWLDIGEGWEHIAAYVVDLSDGQYGGTAGKLALGFGDNTVRADDFGGGSYPCTKRKSGFIRRPWEYEGKALDLP